MTDEEFIESIRLEGEEWKDIEGWERYAISTFGRIVAYSKPYRCGNYVSTRKQKIMRFSQTNNKPSYYTISLSDGKKNHKVFLVHRLVAVTFIPNPNNLPFVNHKDDDATNNRADNLEWCPQQYNCNYGSHNERMAKTISETAYQRKQVVQLSLDGDYINTYDSIAIAANSLNICRTSISLCCRGLKQTGRGYKWMYLSDYKSLVNQ